jgi:hypothetical protein
MLSDMQFVSKISELTRTVVLRALRVALSMFGASASVSVQGATCAVPFQGFCCATDAITFFTDVLADVSSRRRHVALSRLLP